MIIFLNLLDLKLIDFGLSSPIKKNEKLNNTVGTSYFIAPEILSGEYDEKCDMWSIGVILYYLLSGNFHLRAIQVQIFLKKLKIMK